jgi:hypothetical protein
LRRQQLEEERLSAAGLGGPKKVILLTPRSEENETGSQRQDREEGDQLAAAAAQELVGGLFQHPTTDRVYEIMYVFWDPVSGKVVANRRSADGAPSTSDDNYSYEVEGEDGVRALAKQFQEFAGLKNRAHQWPRSESEMRMLQLADPTCRDLIERCEAGEECKVRKHRVYTMPLVSGEHSALRIDISGVVQGPVDVLGAFAEQPATMLPASLQPMALSFFHVGYAHPGIDRMIRSIRTKYYWQGMDKDCEEYVANCRMCKLRKSSRGEGRMPLQRYNVGIRPFQRCHFDLVGPLQKTARGYQYILVAKCAFTQWI